jgi:sugar phosphate isomerase/epimerase
MKLGCAAWSLTTPGYAAPYEEAIDTIAQLGFEGVELILHSLDDLENYYTAKRIRELRDRMSSSGLTLSEFALFNDVVIDLASLNEGKRKRALETFERGAELAKELGTENLNMVSQWAEGLEGPTPYPPHAIYTQIRGITQVNPKLSMRLPRGFDWKRVWATYVETIGKCLEICKAHELRLALEGHTHVILSGTDAFLHLIRELQSERLGVNLDTSWHFMQREYIPLSIYKLGDRIFHTHTRDGDGVLSYGLPPGHGIIDWKHVLQALKDVGYMGFLSFELPRMADPINTIAEAKRYLEDLLERM